MISRLGLERTKVCLISAPLCDLVLKNFAFMYLTKEFAIQNQIDALVLPIRHGGYGEIDNGTDEKRIKEI